jgi:hypothetical protein
MIMKRILPVLIGFAMLFGCNTPKNETTTVEEDYGNPPAEGFNLAASDEKAIEIADEVMEALGGRKNWDMTQHIHWNFFGSRQHTWNKSTGDVRIETPSQELIMLVNINDRTGRVMKAGREITDADTLQQMINSAYSAWVNDSYWLLMPYKLKDSGVTLKYIGKDTTQLGEESELLTLTFDGVGVTPQNKYHVWVGDESKLVNQWAYFPNATDSIPRFVMPWADWAKHGDIMLSGNRGERQLTDIMIFDELPASVYTDFAPVDFSSLGAK